MNTASLAGLVPSPLITPYSAGKHAVVGASLALRAEARAFGVSVHVVCPGVIDTPILDSKGPDDLPRPPSVAGSDTRAMLVRMMHAPYPPQRLAEDVLRGVARGVPVIVAPLQARAAWRAHRYAPWLVRAKLDRDLAGGRARRDASRS